MDLNNYWQENKRFLLTVAGGVLVFGIGTMLVGKYFGEELQRQQRVAANTRTKLAKERMYTANDLAAAEAENEALQRTVETLTKACSFEARPQFQLDAKRGSSSNQYFAIVSAVREDLLRQAGRANLRVPEDLGLPALSPTREPDIMRYLEALDLVDRVIRMALATGCERIDKIEIRLDPRLNSREGVGQIESSRVKFTFSGKGAPLAQLLLASQQPGGNDVNGVPFGGPLLIEKSEMVPTRTGTEANLDVTFVCARVAVPKVRPE
jgi:hypothetical protein